MRKPIQVAGFLLAVLVLAVLWFAGERAAPPEEDAAPSAPPEEAVVVCYAALDEEFSRPILEAFEKETGIRVAMKFDTESTKSVGLANALLAEKNRPRCDVFWNNEILNTLRLKRENVLAAYRPEAARKFPAAFRDPDGTWTGFAARCRVLLINTDRVKPAEIPVRWEDLLAPRWKGKLGIAKPLFGTTATQLAVLYARNKAAKETGEAETADLEILHRLFREHDIQVLGGNKGCAQAVSAGALDAAFTDTDDAIIEKESGKPVELIYFEGGPAGDGALFIPNTLSIIRNAPHPENAETLVEYLLSPRVETLLAQSRSAQIPVNPAVEVEVRVKTPKEVKPLRADWDRAAALFEEAAEWARTELLQR